MNRTLLTAKLHRACVTNAELEYEGSCAIDIELLDAAGIYEFEQLHIYNLVNGERFTTYAIRAERGSGVISMNGAAAHKARPGDRVIICTFASLNEAEIVQHSPRLVYLDEANRITRRTGAIPEQAA